MYLKGIVGKNCYNLLLIITRRLMVTFIGPESGEKYYE